MAIIDIEHDVIVVRIVYDGPPFSGKTTSIHALAKILDKRNTVFSPQEDPLSKTLYFDWMEYCGGFFKGYSISCQIVGVPGQLSLMERRHLLLRTADSVIFVIDASEANTEIALTYFNDLRRLLSSAENHLFPVIIQANKQDKPKALPALQLKTLFPDYPNIKVVDSIAISGKGIREAFVLAVRLALERAEALMVQGQLEHGRPEIDSGEGLFTQLQQELFFQTTQLKSEPLPLVEANSSEQTTIDTTSVIHQSPQDPVTTESTPEMDMVHSTVNQSEKLESEPISFEQLDNEQTDVVVADDSTTTISEPVEDITELSEITTTVSVLPSEREVDELPVELESVDLLEPLTTFEDPDDEEWNEEIEPLLGTEAFTVEEEEFFNQLIANSQVTEEEIEEDLKEPFYPEAVDVNLATLTELLTDESLSFDEIDETVTTDLSLTPPLPTTTEVNEISSLESKSFEELAEDDSNIVLDAITPQAELFEPLPIESTIAEPVAAAEFEVTTSIPEALESPHSLEPPLVKDWLELDDSEPSESLPTEPTTAESVAELETPLSTPEVLESLSLPEPPLAKEPLEFDDSELSESLPTEPATTESVAEVEEVKKVIEPPLYLPEPQEAIVVENSAERDDSEITPLPLVAKEISPESTSSAELSLPLIPDETILNQWIWPPLAGRNWIKTIFHTPIKTIQESKGIWLLEAANNWSGFSKAEWLYHDIQLAKQALHDQIGLHLQCSPILSEQRAIVIATDNKSWRLWQLIQLEITLANHLVRALQEQTMAKLALEVFRCVSHYAEIYLRCAQYPSCLELNLENIGSSQEPQLIYLGIVDSIHQKNEFTSAGLLESLNQLLIEPIKLTKANLNIAAIINELEKIDSFGQQYLLEALIQLFQQV